MPKVDDITIERVYCSLCKKWFIMAISTRETNKLICEECGTELKQMVISARAMYGGISIDKWLGCDINEIVEALIKDAEECLSKDTYYEIRLVPNFSDGTNYKPTASYVSWFCDKNTPQKEEINSPTKWDECRGSWIHSIRKSGGTQCQQN